MSKHSITPPKHLSAAAKAFWRSVQSEYGIVDAGGIATLTLAAEALQTAQAARDVLLEDGVTRVDRLGETREHPACQTQRSAMGAFARLISLLGLQPVEVQG